MANPKAVHARQFLKDPARGEYVPQEVPSITIKRVAFKSTMGANVILGSIRASGTAPLRITRLNLEATRNPTQFGLIDRSGTFDRIMVGTPVAAGPSKILTGGPYAPVYTVLGSFVIRNLTGSIGAGSYIASFEGIQ